MGGFGLTYGILSRTLNSTEPVLAVIVPNMFVPNAHTLYRIDRDMSAGDIASALRKKILPQVGFTDFSPRGGGETRVGLDDKGAYVRGVDAYDHVAILGSVRDLIPEDNCIQALTEVLQALYGKERGLSRDETWSTLYLLGIRTEHGELESALTAAGFEYCSRSDKWVRTSTAS